MDKPERREDKLIKIWKLKQIPPGDYFTTTEFDGIPPEVQCEAGYFITKEQLVDLLETALNNSGAIYDYDIERNLKDLGVE